MAWQPKKYLETIRKFLMDYPDFQPFQASENEQRGQFLIDYMKIDEQNNLLNPQGYAAAPIGMNIIGRKEDITGNVILRKRINFVLLIRRYAQDNFQRLDMGDFLPNFIDWINTENELKTNPLLPRFSDTQYEQIIADGGMGMGVDENGLNEYMIQIHLEFETTHRKPSTEEW